MLSCRTINIRATRLERKMENELIRFLSGCKYDKKDIYQVTKHFDITVYSTKRHKRNELYLK